MVEMILQISPPKKKEGCMYGQTDGQTAPKHNASGTTLDGQRYKNSGKEGVQNSGILMFFLQMKT